MVRKYKTKSQRQRQRKHKNVEEIEKISCVKIKRK